MLNEFRGLGPHGSIPVNHEAREEIETAYGGKLDWQRLSDKQGCRVCDTLPGGGWTDDATWDEVIPRAFEKVQRLYAAFSPRLSG
ncbi:MAG: DUF4268 domain-containing protein [Planctomycetes bacterium]|nr:DUF4268 domain-containing protein [Planctomycetota bacterium]